MTLTLLSSDLDDVAISAHAQDRFRRRFPEWDLESAFHRAVPMTIRETWRLCPEAGCDKPLRDPDSGAIFLCNRDRNDKTRFVCATVIESNRV
jgi:hypothetical protein